MTVLGSERWSEGVDVTDCVVEVLNAQLSTDSKVGWLAEEVFLVVDLPLFKWECCTLLLFLGRLLFLGCLALFLLVFLLLTVVLWCFDLVFLAFSLVEVLGHL